MTDIDVRPAARRRTRPPKAGPQGVPDVAVSGLLDITDRAWLRADGYRPGPDDLVVPQSQVRGVRRGDHITGTARLEATGRTIQHLRVDTINGEDPRVRRPAFADLTAEYPRDRLRLETTRDQLMARMIDLVMPIGKGQRALVVAPPKAGKTMVLEAVAHAIAHNHPECHLMALLVDERPEEVTALRRSVRGEVIAATFDRPPADHTAVAELAIERAKRMVESGRDVVVLLDSLTRLARAYNLLAPGRGRTLSGGLDATALFPPKHFLGAARSIAGGGSLTIIATALVETGSAMDTLIFEELKSTGNAELKLDRSLAEARIYPAIDVHGSGTRRDDLLLGPAELALTHRLRQALTGPDRRTSTLQVLDRLRRTDSNTDFLRALARA